MSSKENKKTIKKTEWVSKFKLCGKAIVNDYTFKINEKSDKSKWVYNALNIGLDCGEKHGTIYSEMMGGYGEDRDNVIYAHGKDEKGNDDYEAQIIVDWEDRLKPEILESIGKQSFITIGLEKTNEGKVYYKDFLSEYDAVEYINQHLKDGMILNVSGKLKYSEYNGNVQVKKIINRVVLNTAETPEFKATFEQSILIDKDSTSLKKDGIDVEKGVMYVNARVLDYVKEYNGVEVRGQFPFKKQFEFEMDFNNEAQCKKVHEKLFKVKKNITQVGFEGDLIEGGVLTNITLDDIPDDIKDLIDLGIYTEEQAIEACASNKSSEKRMVLRKPIIRIVGEEDNKAPKLLVIEDKYTEDDLYLDYVYEKENEEETYADEDDNSSSVSVSSDDTSWLDLL